MRQFFIVDLIFNNDLPMDHQLVPEVFGTFHIISYNKPLLSSWSYFVVVFPMSFLQLSSNRSSVGARGHWQPLDYHQNQTLVTYWSFYCSSLSSYLSIKHSFLNVVYCSLSDCYGNAMHLYPICTLSVPFLYFLIMFL